MYYCRQREGFEKEISQLKETQIETVKNSQVEVNTLQERLEKVNADVQRLHKINEGLCNVSC